MRIFQRHFAGGSMSRPDVRSIGNSLQPRAGAPELEVDGATAWRQPWAPSTGAHGGRALQRWVTRSGEPGGRWHGIAEVLIAKRGERRGPRTWPVHRPVRSSFRAAARAAAKAAFVSAVLCVGAATAGPSSSAETGLPRASAITDYASTLIGTPYLRRGTTPERGFDCSGFVQHVFREAGAIDLPRTSREMARTGRKVDLKGLRQGDLVFFSTQGAPFSHVAIYVGNGSLIHAPSSGGAVRLVNMDLPYWRAHYSGARRVLGAGAASAKAVRAPGNRRAAAKRCSATSDRQSQPPCIDFERRLPTPS